MKTKHMILVSMLVILITVLSLGCGLYLGFLTTESVKDLWLVIATVAGSIVAGVVINSLHEQGAKKRFLIGFLREVQYNKSLTKAELELKTPTWRGFTPNTSAYHGAKDKGILAELPAELYNSALSAYDIIHRIYNYPLLQHVGDDRTKALKKLDEELESLSNKLESHMRKLGYVA